MAYSHAIHAAAALSSPPRCNSRHAWLSRSALRASLIRALCHRRTTIYDTHQLHLPVPERPLKNEVIFCVQGVISPLLANIFMHYALDLWVHQWRKRNARGRVIIVRYCDDFVMGFRYAADAQRMLANLKERLAKFK